MREHLTIREVAEYLRVSRQRADVIAAEDPTFPDPVARTPAGRVWDRREVEAWAEANWWGTRPWRAR